MNTNAIITSLKEEVTRHTGLAALSKEEVIRRGHRHKADTIRAAIEIIEREGKANGEILSA